MGLRHRLRKNMLASHCYDLSLIHAVVIWDSHEVSDRWVSQRTMVSSHTNADISVPTRMICISCKKHFLAVVEIINVSTNSDVTNT